MSACTADRYNYAIQYPTDCWIEALHGIALLMEGNRSNDMSGNGIEDIGTLVMLVSWELMRARQREKNGED